MQRIMMKSKIHGARVTEACIDYEGSITIDSELMEAANMLEYEKVDIYDINNGERFSTYVIKGEPGSRVICLNGAAARKVAVNDRIIIVSYVVMDESECKDYEALRLFTDENNCVTKTEGR